MTEEMTIENGNIVLIGMPGSGKTTIGTLLAERLGLGFVDTDHLIQSIEERPLQSIVDNDGYLALRRIEEGALLNLECNGQVISTGGSAVYSESAMRHLKEKGKVVFLDVELEALMERIDNFTTRGLAKRADQSLADLFAERFPLYARYADHTILCTGLGAEEICVRICDLFGRKGEGDDAAPAAGDGEHGALASDG